MQLLIITERVIAISFLLWLGWLFTFNQMPPDGYDIIPGIITCLSIIWNYRTRKKIFINPEELKIFGKLWRLLIGMLGLVAAAIILAPKIPSGDISAQLILWLFLLTFLHELGLRLKAWQMSRYMKDESSSDGTE